MRSALRLLITGVATSLVVLTGCRSAADPPERDTVAAEIPRRPWAPPRPDSLYGATAVENLRVIEVVIEARGIPRGWDGMRIALLSDLRIGAWRDNVRVAEAAVRAVMEANPDLVVLAGNLLAEGGSPAQLGEVLRPLRDRPTFAVLGVSDVRTDSVATLVASAIRGAGIAVLRNEAAGFTRGGDTAYVVGIEPVPGTSSPRALGDVLAGFPEGAATPLLISNLPEILGTVPEGRFPVILSGNAFCGTAEIPQTPRFTDLVEGPLAYATVPRANRLFHSGGSVLFIGCGTGYSFVPIRWGSAPEVPIVTIHRIPERPQPTGAEPPEQ